ncbi:MAG: diacylglycerol kinase [Planctomyces sp.]|nr:diacylglycerol kinase [Planctomyces sp.]
MAKELVFWNSGSGKSDEVDLIRDALTDNRAEWVELSWNLDLPQTIEKAISQGCRTVVAAGGDGTVNALVNAMMAVDEARRPALAIIPLGTANDFAGTLNIPDVATEAVKLIDASAPIPIDVVRISSGDEMVRYYANVAAGGNSVRVSEAMTDEIKSRWGAFAYIRGGIEVLSDMTTYRITVKCGEEEFSNLDTWAVLVANGKTNAGRITIAPKASPVDGLIDVIIIRDGDLSDMVQIIADNLFGEFLDCEQVIFRQVKSLDLQSEPRMRFALDGEVVDEEPVLFNVVPGAIRMYVGTHVFD